MSDTPRNVSPKANQYIRDAELIMHDGTTAITSGTYGQVGGSAKVLDLGTGALPKGTTLVVDFDNIKVSAGDELFRMTFQVGNTADFSDEMQLGGMVEVGADVANTRVPDDTVGRFEVPVTNVIKGTQYRYARLKHIVSGTSPDFKYTAFLSKG